MCSRFLYLCPGSSGYGYKSCNMQQTIPFESSAQVQQPIDVRATIQRKAFFSKNIWWLQNFLLSLPCQKIISGTDAASSRWLFLYPQTSESNITAPCRVCGNAPGSPANETLTTRSAVSLCQKSLVMATTITATCAAQRAFSLQEWTDAKRKSLNLWLSTPSNFYTQLCEFPVTRLLAIRVNLLSLCIIVGATAIEQQPVVSVVSALCAAWLVYRINQSDKKGGTL